MIIKKTYKMANIMKITSLTTNDISSVISQMRSKENGVYIDLSLRHEDREVVSNRTSIQIKHNKFHKFKYESGSRLRYTENNINAIL